MSPPVSHQARVAQSAGGTTCRPSVVWVRIPPRLPIPRGAVWLNGRPPVLITGMDTQTGRGFDSSTLRQLQKDSTDGEVAVPCLLSSAYPFRVFGSCPRLSASLGKCHLRGAGCRP